MQYLQSIITNLLTVFMIMMSYETKAEIKFDGYTTSPIEIPSSGRSFDHTFSVRLKSFNSVLGNINIAQNYKLGFSAIFVDVEGSFNTTLPELTSGNLSNLISKISSSKTDTFSVATWSNEITPQSNGFETVSFTLSLNRSRLLNYFNQAPSNHSLKLYVAASDTQWPLYYTRSLFVEIPIRRAGQVKISRLHDVALTPTATSATVNACVFSTTGMASFYFDGRHGDAENPFQLSNNANAPEFIPYRLEMKTMSSGWKQELYEGSMQHLGWMVSEDEDCSSDTNRTNSSFRVTALIDPNKALPAGVYTDTLTIIVYSK